MIKEVFHVMIALSNAAPTHPATNLISFTMVGQFNRCGESRTKTLLGMIELAPLLAGPPADAMAQPGEIEETDVTSLKRGREEEDSTNEGISFPLPCPLWSSLSLSYIRSLPVVAR